MSDQMSQAQARRQRLDEAIGSFLVAHDAGRKPDHREWLARHPDLCPELADFFADRACVDDLIEPMRAASEPVHGVWAAAGLLATTSPERLTTDGPGSPHDEGETAPENGRSRPFPRDTPVRYFGDYEIGRVLGEGGMGIVYKARQLSLDRPVALKMIKAARFASADDVRRFHNEAESVARLDHPHIVPIFEVGQFEDQHYFSMKLIAGEGLDQQLKEFVAEPRRTARLMATMAGAIHHAHQRGILHRDLKPSNILVDAEGQPHVTDFGLAKRVEADSELTQTGAVLGTPAYMAPEQTSAKKGAITTATDVYGLGAILYALLTGRGPFGGTTVLETLDQVRQRPPEPPCSLNPRVPRDLEVICLKCLEKDARRRYASADAMAEDLNRWLAGEPIAARPVGNAARLWMWCRRNPALAGAAGLLVAALVAVISLSLLSADRQSRLAAAETLRADEQTRHADDEARAAAKLKSALAGSNRQLAILYFERGRAAFDRGENGSGLLWMVESLRKATDAGDPAWKHVALANLSSWSADYPKLQSILEHGAKVSCVAISPDDKTVVTGGADNMARLWDTTIPRTFGRRQFTNIQLAGLAFSPDGKTIVTGSWDGTSQLWNVATGRPIGEPLTADHDCVMAVAYGPDGRTVAVAQSRQGARLWNLATRQPIGEPMIHPGAMVQAVAFSPDGKMILTGSQDSTAQLWDAATGRPVGPRMRHLDQIIGVAFSPDGKTIVTGSDDKTARLWDAGTRQPIGKPLEHKDGVAAVAFSPDGRTVLTGCGDNVARLWDVATGLPYGGPMEHQGAVMAVAFSPDGKTVVTGSRDTTARLWSVRQAPDLGRLLDHCGRISTYAFSPDGKTLLTGNEEGKGRLWDVATGRPIGNPLKHEGPVRSTAFSPDGRMALTGDGGGTARLWDVATARPRARPIRHREVTHPEFGDAPFPHQDEINVVAFSPDGKTILIGGGISEDIRGPDGKTILFAGMDWTAGLWDVATGQPIGEPMKPSGKARTAIFSPDGKNIFMGPASSNLWEAATGRPIDKGVWSPFWFGGLTVSPDGKTILVAKGRSLRGDKAGTASSGELTWHPGTIERWKIQFDNDQFTRVGLTIEVPGGAAGPLAWSPDQTTVAFTDPVSGATLWDLTTNRLIHRIHQHEGFVRAAAFSPDGKTVFVGGDGPPRLWDVSTGQPIGEPMPCHEQIEGVAFSPDGKTILTFGPAGARLWDIPGLIPDDLPRITLRVQVMTGMELDEQGSLRLLDSQDWRERRERLERLTGKPHADAARWLGPPPSAPARTPARTPD